MPVKTCEKCGESVDAAKAFCPECGNPFVSEEEPVGSSEIDDFAGTMQYSDSMYKRVLSEMDLDTSQQPDRTERPEPSKAPKTEGVPIDPIGEQREPDPAEKKGWVKWLVLALVAGFLLLLLGASVLIILLKDHLF